MAPTKPAPKAMTPASAKGLMVIEAGAIAFFGFWLYGEYLYNPYFQTQADTWLVQPLTTYGALTGLLLGLTGSFATIALWRNLRKTRLRLETLHASKIKSAVDRTRSTTPPPSELSPPLSGAATVNPLESLGQPGPLEVADKKN